MTPEANEQEFIKNKSTREEKKIISRLILQKILSADATRFMHKDSFNKLSKLLLSESPDEEFCASYRLTGPTERDRDSFYSTIADIRVNWDLGEKEIIDMDGNVWITYSLRVIPVMGNSYSGSTPNFFSRVECLVLVRDLVKELKSMVPGPIRIMTHDNEERLARDARRRHDAVCDRFKSELKSNRRDLRMGLRAQPTGHLRNIMKDDELLKDVLPGEYEFTIDDGSRRKEVKKRYVISVFDPFSPRHKGTPFGAKIARIS